MKHFLATLLVLICTSISVATPPIIVERLPQWGAEYFTIVNTQAFDILKYGDTELINAHIPEANMEYFVPASQTYLNCQVYGSRSMESLIQFPDLYYHYVGLQLGDVIIEIDGESTRNMSYERFYELLSDNANIVYLRKETGELKQYNATIECCNHPEYLTQRGIYDLVAQSQDANRLVTKTNGAREKTEIDNKKKWGLTILKDDTYDWFTANTYDFIIIGEDPLTDKELLGHYEKMFLTNLRRDKDNPDILISIAKNSSERVSSTYVPQTETIVNTGSTTKPKYNYNGAFNRYETVNHYTTHKQGGYTQTTTDTDLFLELVILDAKALRTNPSVPPIIYQATYSQHFTNMQTAILDVYKNVLTHLSDFDPYMAIDTYNVSYAGYEVDDKNIITSINPISMAYHHGLRQGDEIVKIDMLTSQFIYNYDTGVITYTGKEYIMSKEHDCWNSRSKTPLMEFLANQNTLDLRFEFRLMFNGVNTQNRKIPFATNLYKITLKRDNKKQTITIPYPYDKITYTHYYMTR